MKIDESYSDYMYNFVDTICKKFGPRYSCSNAEKEANKWIQSELDKFCDETFIDEFKARPAMYPQGLIKIAGLLGGLSCIFMPLSFPLPIFTVIFVIWGLWVLYSELFLMKEWIKPFFKKRTSSNVFGIIRPQNTAKFRLIFEGHTDSAKVMNLASYKLKKRNLILALGLIYLFGNIGFSLWKFIAQIIIGPGINWFNMALISLNFVDWFYIPFFIITFPFFLWLVKGFLGKEVVMGANDNLAGSAVAVAIGKYLKENRPKNIEVWVGSQGSEEVGDQGAKAFVKKYGSEGILDNAYAIVLECCGAAGKMMLVEKDMHVKSYPKELNDLVQKAYELTKQENPDMLDLEIGRLFIGSCDACRYVHAGYKAIPLFGRGKESNKAVNWHSPQDIPENLEKKVLMDFLKISLKLIEIIDKEYE